MNLPGRRFVKDEEIYSDWFPRGGDNVLIRAQKIDSSGSPTLTIEMYTKNSDDDGNGWQVYQSGSVWSLAVTSSDTIEEDVIISGDTTTGSQPEGMYEMVRFKVSCTGTASGDWMLARIFGPIFYDAGTS